MRAPIFLSLVSIALGFTIPATDVASSLTSKHKTRDLSLLPEENSLVQFFELRDMQGNGTYAGRKDHIEDCVEVTSPSSIDSVQFIDATDEKDFYCIFYDACNCASNTTLKSSTSMSNLNTEIDHYWSGSRIKSFTCRWGKDPDDNPNWKRGAPRGVFYKLRSRNEARKLPEENELLQFFTDADFQGEGTYSGSKEDIEICRKTPPNPISISFIQSSIESKAFYCRFFETPNCTTDETHHMTIFSESVNSLAYEKWNIRIQSYNCWWPKNVPPPEIKPREATEAPEHNESKFLLQLYTGANYTGDVVYSGDSDQATACKSIDLNISSILFIPRDTDKQLACNFYDNLSCSKEPGRVVLMLAINIPNLKAHGLDNVIHSHKCYWLPPIKNGATEIVEGDEMRKCRCRNRRGICISCKGDEPNKDSESVGPNTADVCRCRDRYGRCRPCRRDESIEMVQAWAQ